MKGQIYSTIFDHESPHFKAMSEGRRIAFCPLCDKTLTHSVMTFRDPCMRPGFAMFKVARRVMKRQPTKRYNLYVCRCGHRQVTPRSRYLKIKSDCSGQ